MVCGDGCGWQAVSPSVVVVFFVGIHAPKKWSEKRSRKGLRLAEEQRLLGGSTKINQSVRKLPCPIVKMTLQM